MVTALFLPCSICGALTEWDAQLEEKVQCFFCWDKNSSRENTVAASNRRYYQEHREARAASSRRYRQEHREAIAASRRRYYQEHREAKAASSRRYYQEHREAKAASKRRYYQDHQNPPPRPTLKISRLTTGVKKEPFYGD